METRNNGRVITLGVMGALLVIDNLVRFLSPVEARSYQPAAQGRKIIGSKSLGNCVSCHAITEMSDVPFQGNVGPVLDGVGSRWNEAELRGIVANAKKTYEGTMMPSFYKSTGYIRPGDAYTGKAAKSDPMPPLLSAQQIEDVVAYLTTLKD